LSFQIFDDRCRQDRHAIFLALAVAHCDLVRLKTDILDPNRSNCWSSTCRISLWIQPT
jgi:hypothetical protein